MGHSVAIIGMACRFPGARSVAELWRNLVGGVESIRFFSDHELLRAGVDLELLELPNYVRASPVLDDVHAFDAEFFNFAPREAEIMDPQQRLMLQTSWEALEDAGYAAGATRANVGVFAGCGGVVSSYLAAHLEHYPELIGATGSLAHIGNDKDFVSTRVSFKLNLTGPSLNVQTACSTSLVAVHLACRSLEARECDMALAGVSAIRFPHLRGYVAQKSDILSPDGHCRAFDADAQGTIFGSGVGVVVLKRLEDAIADGDRIDAVIRGTAMNNDGAEKMSYTASSVASQAGAMIEAIVAAGVDADDIGYIECHGTGTAVGDPLEIMALTNAWRAMGSKAKQTCRIGSVKTNIGHLEQAAGMASLIKTALVLRHGTIPPLLNFRKPNPAIDFENSPFVVADRLSDWPSAKPRVALVNGLGLGGTNACCILEEPPAPRAVRAAGPPHAVLCVSGKTAQAARQQALRMAAALDEREDAALTDFCATANGGRAAFPYRLAVAASSRDEVRDALRAAADGEPRRDAPKRPIFLFPGQGSQFPGMAKELYETFEPFRRRFDDCLARVQTHLDAPLLDVLYGERGDLLYDTRYAQPLLFAIEYALARTWESWGVVPAAVLGHSVGEIAAACFAGAMTLDDAAALICKRAQLMGAIERRGAMAAVFATEERVLPIVAAFAESISIAAMNAPENTVVSGDAEAMRELLSHFARKGVAYRELRVSQAFHSPLLDPMLDELEELASRFTYRTPQVPLIGNVTGQPIETLSGRYWREHARMPVRFMDSVRTALATGDVAFLEVGPTALTTLARQCTRGETPAWIASLDRDRADWLTVSHALRELFVGGQAIDWDAVYRPFAPRKVALPTYPFEAKEYALKPRKSATSARSRSTAQDGDHLLAGHRVRARVDEAIFEAAYSVARIPFLDDHRIYGLPVLPTTAALDAALACGRELAGDGADVVVSDVTYWEPLIVPDADDLVVQTIVTPESDGQWTFDLCSDGGKERPEWRRHVGGRVSIAKRIPHPVVDLEAIRRRCTRSLEPDEYYARIGGKGFNYGPLFRAIRSIATGSGEALTRVELDASLPVDAHVLHPALVDAALHIYFALAEDGSHPFLPTGVGMFRVLKPLARSAWVHVTRDAGGEAASETMAVDVRLLDDDGALIAELHRLSLRRMSREMLHPSATDPAKDWVYEIAWREVSEEESGSLIDAHVIVLCDRGGVGASLAQMLGRERAFCVPLSREDEWQASLRAAFAEKPAVDWRIVNLWPLDAEMPEASVETPAIPDQESYRETLEVMRAIARLRSDLRVSARIRFVTRLGQSIETVPRDVDPMQGGVWGMARTFAWEAPQCWDGIVDLDGPASAEASASELLQQLASAHPSEQRAVRDGRTFVAHLIRAASDEARSPEPLFERSAAYLVTGGLGSLGARVAKWMALQGAGRLVLTSRRGREGNERAIADIEKCGAAVTVVAADAADLAAMRGVFDVIETLDEPLTGIFHCAGILDDGVIDQMEWEKFRRVSDPKVIGGWILHQLSLPYQLEHFVLFSSILSLMGSAGQVNYTAGNGFLDALASRRRALGLPSQVMNWGPWDEGGLATSAGDVGRSIWKARGIGYIPPDGGMEVLDDLVRREKHSAAIMIADWSRFLRQFSAAPDFYSELARESGAAPSARRDSAAEVKRRLREAPVEERRQLLISAVATEVASVLGIDGSLDPAVQTAELGLDSLMAVNLLNRLDALLDRPVAIAKLIQGPSVIELVDQLYPELRELAAATVPEREVASVTPLRTAQWLVPIRPNPDAAVRLICFPFAGGGSAAFRRWDGLVDPSIELLVVEPPGRLRRIEEQPINSIVALIDEVSRVILESCTDKPFAFFGHCLGGLTLFETAGRLRSHGVSPTHVFVSGARPPHLLAAIGPFERRLAKAMLDHPRYDPLQPLHRQNAEVFSAALRLFDIPETEQLLADEHLRDVLLPAIRAEFEMAFNYRAPIAPRGWNVPFTCMTGEHDNYVSRAQMMEWSRYTDSDFQIFVRPGSHFLMAENPEFIVGTMNRELRVVEKRERADVA